VAVVRLIKGRVKPEAGAGLTACVLFGTQADGITRFEPTIAQVRPMRPRYVAAQFYSGTSFW
jgi:hypothetical protein